MTVELVGGVAWDPALRARVYPSRQIPNPAYLEQMVAKDGGRSPFDRAATREAARYYWADQEDVERAEAGLAENPPHWRRAVAAAIERCKEPDRDIPLDVEVEAATVTLEMCPVFAALPYWIAAGGIPFALRTLIRCHELASYAKQYGYGRRGTWILETRAFAWNRPEYNEHAWRLLRAVLAAAVEPVYDEAHGIADEARLRTAGGTPGESALQLWLPFAFPDEHGWAAAASKPALALAKQAKRGYTPGLARYVAVAPVATAVELLTCTINTALTGNDLVTALAHHGAAGGTKVIVAAVEGAPNQPSRKAYATELLAVRTTEAARELARLAEQHPALGKLASTHAQLVGAKPPKPPKRRAKR